jgi:ubiquinone/menaquinone biosynthesis C-methylase UbiE
MFQEHHEILPQALHDEFAREEFCSSIRKLFTTELWPGNREIYAKKLLPAFVAKNGREPETMPEVKSLMNESFYFRSSNAFGRAAQELLWDTVGESVERQLDSLVEMAKPRKGDLGTVRVNPELPMPRYIESVDIHVMPGNFHTEIAADDVFAGALYDRGVYVFAFGGLGKQNEGLGVLISQFAKERFPDCKPKRILDMGCGPGFTTLPWKDLYPDAEVYGIDIGAPQIRYAHGRAEALGKAIHFSQQDATHTDFPDGYFDIVVSLLVTHEMPVPAMKAMFSESYRLLASKGIMVHDGGLAPPDTPFDLLMVSWFGMNANEPFSMGYRTLDFKKAFAEAGFSEEKIFQVLRQPVYLKDQLPPTSLMCAVKD